MGLLNNYEEACGNMIWYLFLAVQEGAVPMSEERKLVTILFADVTGSTALSA
jgi:class 3 adenylate cyclase